MSTIQLVINGNQVEGEIEQLAAILARNTSIMTQPAVVANNEPQELIPFNAFLEVELTPHFGAKGATFIVEKLKLCRKCNNFVYIKPIYKLAKDDVIKYELLTAISAIYRYKFGVYSATSTKYSLKSIIKHVQKCPECGKFAKVFVDRLIAEKLWK